MSKTERDPLFFPPSKYPEEGEQPEEYSAEIDPKAQQKGLRLVSIIALVLLGFILIGIRPAWLHAPWRGAASGLDGSPAQSSGDSAEISEQQADRFATLPPQQQVETLLQLALRGKPGAPSQILQRAEAWRGKISDSLSGTFIFPGSYPDRNRTGILVACGNSPAIQMTVGYRSIVSPGNSRFNSATPASVTCVSTR